MITTKCRSGTGCRESSDLDRELSDVLIAISVVSRRIADRLSAGDGKLNMEGGSPHGKSKRIVVDELKKCGETLISISEELTGLFSSAEPEKQPIKKSAAKKKEPEPPAEKELTLEEVRAVLADKSRAGFTEQVKELLKKHGADKLSAVDPAEYKALLADAEVLGNAG